MTGHTTGPSPSQVCRPPMGIVTFAGRRLGVPLAQIDPVKPDKATREAVEDWGYWMAMGHEF